MMGEVPSLIAFDLDDTLAVSKSKIDPHMAELLVRLLGQRDVCIISGGRFEQFESQILTHLDAPSGDLSRLHIMPTCGTRYYRWSGDEWRLQYAQDLSADEKKLIIETLTEGAKQLGFWEANTWGEIIEDRGSQITYSALGQAAPVEAKYRWDPDGSKKQKLRDWTAAKVPSLEVRVGGSTSVDVTRKGIDKAYGINQLLRELDLSSDDLIFVGDRLKEGGNDYPVKALGIECIEVTCWQDTALFVEQFLSTLSSLGE